MIVNITTKVEKNIEKQWLDWVQNIYLMKLKERTYISLYKLFLLLIEDNEPTYVLQLFFSNAKEYEKFITGNTKTFHSEQQQLFGNHCISFETLMQEII